jgi:nitrogen fixation/metabolism regulation signal transduction histidine kinase
MLANLMTNGIEALAGVAAWLCRDQYAATACRRGSYRCNLCRDNGPGFRKELLGTAVRSLRHGKPRGTGLGLAIVKRIVEEHGGRVEAENRPRGRGANTVFLPVSDQDRTLLAGGERRMEMRRERA